MSDGELVGMEHEATWVCFLAVRLGVDGIGKDGGADVAHVDADLVGASSVEITEDE